MNRLIGALLVLGAAGLPACMMDAGDDGDGVESTTHALSFEGAAAGASAVPLELSLPPAGQCDRWASIEATVAGTGTCTPTDPCPIQTCVGALGATYQVCCLLPSATGGSYHIEGAGLVPSNSGTASRPLVLRKAPSAPLPATTPGVSVSPCTLNEGRVRVRLDVDDELVNFAGHDFWVVEGIDFDLNRDAFASDMSTNSAFFIPHNSRGVQLRNVVVREGSFKTAVNVSGDDVQVRDSCIYDNFRANQEDAKGVAVIAVPGTGFAERVRVAGSWIYDNGGDGVLCSDNSAADSGGCTPGPGCAPNPADSPREIWIQDNRIFTTTGRQGQTENAVDIKSCTDVTIGGSVSPRSNSSDSAVAQNKFAGFRGKPSSKQGAAVVIHVNAKRILVENSRIFDVGTAFSIGRLEPYSLFATEDIVIRGNLIFAICAPPPGVPNGNGCNGNGIILNKARRVDIFDNTIANVPKSAILIGSDLPDGPDKLESIDIWNNIITTQANEALDPRYLDVKRSALTDFESAYNLFWSPGATASSIRFTARGCGAEAGGLAFWQGCDNNVNIVTADNVGSTPFASRIADPLLNTLNYTTAPGSPVRDSAQTGLGVNYPQSQGLPDKGWRETYDSGGSGARWPINDNTQPDADRLEDPYGPRLNAGAHDFHAGIDIAATTGTDVHAVLPGTVTFVVPDWDDAANPCCSAGRKVVIDHGGPSPGRKSTAYLHLSATLVQVGNQLPAGAVVGRVGTSGARHPHLHLTYMVDKPGADSNEAFSRNPLEILPHTPPSAPAVTIANPLTTIVLPVQRMTVRRIRLEGEGSSREVDYYQIVTRGNPARDEQVQGDGLYMETVNPSEDPLTFPLRVRPHPLGAFDVDSVTIETLDGQLWEF